MRVVRVGVIGVGHLGQHHARILSDMEGASLAAVVISLVAFHRRDITA